MSGIETVGLLLGVLPLLVLALEHFQDGLRLLRNWWKYRRVLRDFVMYFRGEMRLFEQKFEALLWPIVGSQMEMDSFLANPKA